jgi:DNA polymerase-3 subunit alpha
MIILTNNYVPIHVHTNFSLLDGLTRPKDLVDKTIKLGMPAVVVTDHGNLYHVVDTAQYAEKKGQKYIPGFEAYMVDNAREKNKEELHSSDDGIARKHFLLLAKNNDGYKRLMKICSWGLTDGFYARPRIDNSVLEYFGTDGLIASSACIAGPIAQKLVHDDYAGAKKLCEYYARLFKDGFYLEIQPTYEDNGRQVIANKGLIELSKDIGLPLIATTDAHYLNKEDAKTHDVLLCLQSKSLVSDPNRWKFPGDTYYIMDRNELTNSFKMHGHETLDQKLIQEAMDNTLDIAKQCNVTFKWGNHVLPKINPPKLEEEPELVPKFYMFEGNRVEEQAKEFTFSYDDKPADYNGSFDVKRALTDSDKSYEYLRFLCLHGRYGALSKHHCTREYLDRMDYELDVIKSMGFPSYFLVEYDIMDHCHKTGIPVGPGRGCFTKGCTVMTNDGLKDISEVMSGEYVLSHDGMKHEVIGKQEFNCTEDVVNLECTDGSKIAGTTKDHRIFAIKKYDYDRGLREPQWIPANELMPGDLIACSDN